MPTTIVLFTRDLRVHDHPGLDAAAAAGEVVPLFVLDDEPLRLFGGVNRVRFLLESLRNLRDNLRARGGDLFVRRGDTVAEAIALAREVGATGIHVTTDASAYARRRLRRLRSEASVEVRTFPGIAAVDPGELTPASGDHYRVFTPYLRAWNDATRRPLLSAPENISRPSSIRVGSIPSLRTLSDDRPSPDVVSGGETEGRRRAGAWLGGGVNHYDDMRNALGADATSRLSAYLHFGCVSPLELVVEAPTSVGGREFVRQLCWRDFFLQVLNATPDYPRVDYRAQKEEWIDDDDALERWKQGHTGVPIVDAGMRQLTAEGWMHNRARLVTGSFLTRNLKIDWRARRQPLLGTARRRRSREQRRQLAMGRGHGQCHAARGDDESPSPGKAIRSRG